MLLALSQASAFSASSTSLRKTAEIPNASMEGAKIDRLDFVDVKDELDEWEHVNDNFEEDEEKAEINDEDDEDFDEEEYENQEDNFDEDENDWTLEERLLMDRLFNRYIQQIVEKYGADWEEEYEIDVDKEGLYEEYLKFEREQNELEEKRKLSQAFHNVLLEHDGSIDVEENDCFSIEPQNRTEEQASGLRHYPQSRRLKCGTPTGTPTTIITTRSGNTQNVIGPI